MKLKLLIILLLIVTLNKTFSQNPCKVFLMAGQSNMAGTCGNDQDPYLIEMGIPDPEIQIKVFGTASHEWQALRAGLGSVEIASGPEVGFGHAMADFYAETNKIRIIKGAWSGTDLNVSWRPPSAGGITGDLYEAFVTNVKESLDEIDEPYEIIGMCWLQGESDCFDISFANAYEANLTHFISDLRKEFNQPNMLFSIAQIMEDPVYTHHEIVRKAQARVAERDPLTGIFDPTGLSISGGHWIGTACSVIGKEFAENLAQMIKNKKNVGIAYSPWFPPTTWLTEGGCTWGMPALGAYHSDNIKVIDQHIEWLAEAGVDFIQLDWSNNIDYLPGCNCNEHIGMIEDASDVLIDRMVWRKKNGLSWIKVAVMIGGGGNDAYTNGKIDAKTQNVKERYIDDPDRRSVYYEHRGKPLLVDYCHGSYNYLNWNKSVHEETFTIRHAWATLIQNKMYDPETMHSQNGLWSWSENVHPMAYSYDGRPECATLHAALRTCGWMTPADSLLFPDVVKGMKDCFDTWGGAKGRRNGATLRESFKYARQYNVDLAMVMAFNEWTGCEGSHGEQRNPEFSNDIEPMESGHGDLYLKILGEEIAKFKGVCVLDTILFEPIDSPVTDSIFTVKATALSGLTVNYEVVSGPAIIEGSTILLTQSNGKVTIRAYHNGESPFCSADAYTSFDISHTCISQEIFFETIEDRLVSMDTIHLNAKSDKEAKISFKVVSGPAELISDTSIRLSGQRGTVTILASQEGSYTYCKAPEVNRSFHVSLPPHQCADCEGYVTYEQWNNIIGGTVDLIPLDSFPDMISTLSQMESSRDIGDDYGARLRGYLCAPFNGEYTFYIAGDDGNQLWLSTDEEKINKRLIASVPGWTPYRDWSVFSSQKSDPVSLMGGNKYYIEVLLKEYKGGDHVSVRWTGPYFIDEIISGDFLSPACIHQDISFSSTATQVSDSMFVLNAQASSGLPLLYKIFSGPATMTGDTIKLTDKRGRIVVNAYQYGDENYCMSPPKQQVFVLTATPMAGIEAHSSDNFISIFPNPVSDKFSIECVSPFKIGQQCRFELFDILGRQIFTNISELDKEHVFDISGVPGGTYIFRLTTPDRIITKLISKL